MTPKQRQFAHEYVIDRNGKAAAIRAGYSEASAKGTASDMLATPEITELVSELEADVEEKTLFTAETVIKTFLRVIDEAFEKGDLAAVNIANSWLGKHKGMFTEKVQVTLTQGIAERLKRARERVKRG
jgi:phage terminase small subunit